MTFYQSISYYFDRIFPLNQRKVTFVKTAIPNANANILDIGCGTGNLTNVLHDSYKNAVGVDIDNSMIETARTRKSSLNSTARFEQCDMTRLDELFAYAQFDSLLCFGNTLVHLSDKEEISKFFGQAKKMLKEEGKLLLQIVNYDRILDQDINHLPTIDNESVTFIRNYELDRDNNKVVFNTELYLKNEKETLTNSVVLYPLRKLELENLLQEAGFGNFKFYGDFKRDLLTDDSLFLVVEAELL